MLALSSELVMVVVMIAMRASAHVFIYRGVVRSGTRAIMVMPSHGPSWMTNLTFVWAIDNSFY